jgi:hypothetical protein
LLGYMKILYQHLSRVANIYFIFFRSSVSTAAEKDGECQLGCLGQGSQYPEPGGGVKFYPGQLSSLSTYLCVLRMVHKLAGGREVVEFQLTLLTNKSPTKPESGGTVSSQHQLSGKVHIRLLPTRRCSTYKTKHQNPAAYFIIKNKGSRKLF